MIRMPVHYQGDVYFFEGITGSLMRRPAKPSDAAVPTIEGIAGKCLSEVTDPYLLKGRALPTTPQRISLGVRLYASILTWLCRYAFPLGRLWAKIPLSCYPDAGVATRVYYKLYPGEQQRNLCLPRAFFARSTSRRFRKHGAMFIGVFLPSVQMHAWVLEDGMHADYYDNNWVNYAPVAIFR